MNKRKRIAKRGKIARLMASDELQNLPPELTQKWRGYYRPIKKPVTLRVDADVLAWLKKPGRGYQTRINRALRQVMTNEQKKSGQ